MNISKVSVAFNCLIKWAPFVILLLIIPFFNLLSVKDWVKYIYCIYFFSNGFHKSMRSFELISDLRQIHKHGMNINKTRKIQLCCWLTGKFVTIIWLYLILTWQIILSLPPQGYFSITMKDSHLLESSSSFSLGKLPNEIGSFVSTFNPVYYSKP